MISYREFHEKINQDPDNQSKLQAIDLFYLIHNKKREELEFFLTNVDPKPNLEVRDVGYTPLMLAAKNADLRMLTCLLEAKAEVNSQSRGFGETALMLLVNQNFEVNYSKRILCIKTLLEAKADINLKGGNEKTILHHIHNLGFKENYSEVLSFLLEAKADPNLQCKYGKTALMNAAFSKSVDGVKILLSKGAEVHHRDCFGKTALDYTNDAECKALIKAVTPATSICEGFFNRLFNTPLATHSHSQSNIKINLPASK